MKQTGTNLLACLPTYMYFRSTDYLRSKYVVPTKRAISEDL